MKIYLQSPIRLHGVHEHNFTFTTTVSTMTRCNEVPLITSTQRRNLWCHNTDITGRCKVSRHTPRRRMEQAGVQLHSLTTALDELLASPLGRFISGETDSGTHWKRDHVVPAAHLDTSEDRKISYRCRKSNYRFLGRQTRSLVTIPTAPSRLQYRHYPRL